ncbi:MAG TPA: hypothetical protein EYO59_10545, partial [Chromatiaceae bacterium]|nr:hypothetical protein [Chromatiaceae bacterium]
MYSEKIMISIKHKFLFVHIPKTGGNSIQQVLKDFSEDDIVCVNHIQDGVERFEVRNSKYNITKHSTYSDYSSIIEPDIFSQLFKVATIRNPWDRAISFYFSPHRGDVTWDRASFSQFLLN